MAMNRVPARPVAIAAALLAAAGALAGCAADSRGAAAGPGAAAGGAGAGFALDRLWDDGQAEISAYDASILRYGAPRGFVAYHVVVKEDFARGSLVKADPGHDPSDLVPVLKLNQVIEFRTGVYSYHQMASTFHERATMDLLKFSLASFEWCGNTYKEYTRRGRKGALHVRTYWEGQAEATYDVPVAADVVFRDALPLSIRALPQRPGTSLRLRLVPGQIDSQGARPDLVPALLEAAALETVRVPAGSFDVVRWELRPEGASAPEIFHVGRAFPHPLVSRESPDGFLRLRWTRRLAYWLLNQPGDEKHLGPAVEGGAPPAQAGPSRP